MRSSIRPENFPEWLVWHTIIGTYILFYTGAQFIWIPSMAWGLTAYLVWQWWNEPLHIPKPFKVMVTSPVWVWIIAVIGIEIALIMGHINFELGTGLIIKSTLNRWGRQWALLALFPLLGTLHIRPQLLVRAICILCCQTFIFVCISGVARIGLNISEIEFVSPLSAFGGGDIFYIVRLFGTDVDNTELRMQLFAPWAPALALVGNLFFWSALQEQQSFWRWMGILGSTSMVLSSISRLGYVVLPIVGITLFLLKRIRSPYLLLCGAGTSFIFSLFASPILNALNYWKNLFTQARAGSSEVRATLQDIALYRWWNDAPVWGHGTIEPTGPKVVSHVSIGTHHFWFGTLYTFGAVGCILVAIAFLWSLSVLLTKFWDSSQAQLGLSLWLVLFFFSWGENLEIISYVMWPGLLLMGITYRHLDDSRWGTG